MGKYEQDIYIALAKQVGAGSINSDSMLWMIVSSSGNLEVSRYRSIYHSGSVCGKDDGSPYIVVKQVRVLGRMKEVLDIKLL